MKAPSIPIYKDVLLIGGGHSHVQVLKRFGMKPIPGVRVTLITPDVQTPYSGMLPGYVSGFYTYDDCHIDLLRLAQFSNARLIQAQANGVDVKAQHVTFTDPARPPLSYDVLSINIGIAPSSIEVPGAMEYTIPVKPISAFATRFQAMLKAALSPSPSANHYQGTDDACVEPHAAYSVAIVGGGPSGVELACAVQYRLTQERLKKGITAPVSVSLISRGPILAGLSPYARRAFLPLLKKRNIRVYESEGGVAIVNDQHTLTLKDGTVVAFDACLWCTQAGAAQWLADSGLPTDDRGFLRLNDRLQADFRVSSTGENEHAEVTNIFGAGDCTTNVRNPRPKAGVYAVRAGIPLAENIAAYIENRPLKEWKPQSTHLNLISAGDKYAVGVKGGWPIGVQGNMIWRLKDRIDRNFMNQFGSDLVFDDEANMAEGGDGRHRYRGGMDPQAAALLASSKMRCGGCGAKVGASTLSRVLSKLSRSQNHINTIQNNANCATDNESVATNKLIFDDGAVLPAPPTGHVTIHTVDFFNSFISDPYIFGAIAANHALSDCYAMGASPIAAMAIAVVPYAAQSVVESDLHQMMAGAQHTLNRAGYQLVGGHSSEGSELSLGFSVYGSAKKEDILYKSVVPHAQMILQRPTSCLALILTKPIGTGVLFAAAMRGVAQGTWVSLAVATMLQSNKEAMEVLKDVGGAVACTDVTGFGLLGHLAEMVVDFEKNTGMDKNHVVVNLRVELNVHSIPILSGAKECVELGVLSSLATENAKIASVVANFDDFLKKDSANSTTQWHLMVDPQTSGGLLAAVPMEMAEACVDQLRRRAGCERAAVIGRIVAPGETGPAGLYLMPTHS